MLKIKNVDWHLLENAEEHHTDRYEIIHEESTPVLRRSQPFRLSFDFDRAFNEDTDRIRLFFTHGNQKLTPRLQSVADNTTVTSANELNDSRDNWSLQMISQKTNTVSLLVRSPPTAAWGVWNLTVKTSLKSSPKTEIWKSPKQFYLIFNPWSSEDDVYMPETRYLNEYILNDVGKVYTSTAKNPKGMKWIFGQFAAPVLKVITHVLDERDLDEETLGSPKDLCFHLARSLGEIITGNWSGHFADGTAPWLWTGSIPIYEKFLTTKQPVKYGQCFVYSGVYNTALRAVGIPARSVSNFVSASAGDKMSVSHIFDNKGISINSDSVWNFHVWNDAWMARFDLPVGYGGWQATDATNGYGPAPVEAIKKGEICVQFNVKDMTSEVNADRVRWTQDENEEYHLVSVDTKHVGRSLLTKQPFIYDPHGDCDYEDVMSYYKEREGSKEERMSIYNAIKLCKKEEDEWTSSVPYHIDMPTDEETGVKFEFEEIESVSFGQPLNVIIDIQNTDESEATVEICMGVSSVYYNGAVAGVIKRETKAITVKPKSSEKLTMKVSPEEYAAKLVDFTSLKLHALAVVKQTNFTWANDAEITIDMPEISIEAKKDLEVKKEGIIVFTFKNELNTKLTKCSLTYEAPGIGSNVKVDCKDFKPHEEVIIEVKVKPSKAGEIPIKAIFKAKELNFFGGSSYVEVM